MRHPAVFIVPLPSAIADVAHCLGHTRSPSITYPTCAVRRIDSSRFRTSDQSVCYFVTVRVGVRSSVQATSITLHGHGWRKNRQLKRCKLRSTFSFVICGLIPGLCAFLCLVFALSAVSALVRPGASCLTQQTAGERGVTITSVTVKRNAVTDKPRRPQSPIRPPKRPPRVALNKRLFGAGLLSTVSVSSIYLGLGFLGLGARWLLPTRSLDSGLDGDRSLELASLVSSTQLY